MINIIQSQTTELRLRHIGLEFSCRQWGYIEGNNNWDRWYPIAFTEACFTIVANDASALDKSIQYIGINNLEKYTFKMYTSSGSGLQMSFVAIGK